MSPDHKGKTDTSLIDLEYMWRQIVGEEHDTLVPRFTPQQRGQLRQFVQRCPKGQARAVIETCLRDWCYFVHDAERKAGAFKCPDQPELGFLLRYIEPAVNYYLDEAERCARQRECEAKREAHDQEVKAKAAAAKVQVQLIATPSPSKQAEPWPEDFKDDPPATKEEVMAILFGDEDPAPGAAG